MMAGIASYGDAGIGYVTILLLWLRQTKWFNGPCTTYGSEVQHPPPPPPEIGWSQMLNCPHHFELPDSPEIFPIPTVQ